MLQGMSPCFTFGNAKIDGLVLAKDGLIFNVSVAEELVASLPSVFRWSIPPKRKIDPGMSDRDKFGSRNYQLILRRMQLLPCTSYVKASMLDPKGKRKASEEAHGQSPAKTSAGAQDLLDMDL